MICNAFIYLQYADNDAYGALNKPLPETVHLHDGDVVLRDGKGFISSVFRQSSLQQKRFTHAGFIHKKNNAIYVYHYLDDKAQSGLHIETFADYVSSDKSSAFAIVRYDLPAVALQQLNNYIATSPLFAVAFDSGFDLCSDSTLYCTEWIAKALAKASNQKDFIPETMVGSLTYIAPDNLYLNNHCKIIYESN